MTVEIGALCADAAGRPSRAAVVASDRMVTLGRLIEFEHDVSKIMRLSVNIVGLSAGDAVRGSELVRDIRASVPAGRPSVESVAKQAARCYVELRRKLVQNDIFTPRGITLSDFYEGLQQRLLPQIAGLIDQQVTAYTVGVDVMLVGVDDAGSHLYTVTNPGEDRDFATIGYQAIGSGSLQAIQSMIGFDHTPRRPLSDTVFSVYASKRRAEAAPGVGRATDMAIITDGGVEFVAQSILDQLDAIYQDFQRPVTEEVRQQLAQLPVVQEHAHA